MDKYYDLGEWDHPFLKQVKYLEDGIYLYQCTQCERKFPLAERFCEFVFCPFCGFHL